MTRLCTVLLLLVLVVIAQDSRATTVLVSGSLCGSDNSIGGAGPAPGIPHDDKFNVQFALGALDPDSGCWLNDADSIPDHAESELTRNLWADSAGPSAPWVDDYAPSHLQSP